MDSSSNEADETIRYLYRLDELDEILAANQRILTEIQNAEGKRGTSSSLSNLRTRQSDIDAIRTKLKARCEKLRQEIATLEAEKAEKERLIEEARLRYMEENETIDFDSEEYFDVICPNCGIELSYMLWQADEDSNVLCPECSHKFKMNFGNV